MMHRTLVYLLFPFFLLQGCGKNETTNKTPSSEFDDQRNSANHIQGRWNIAEISTSHPKPEIAWLKTLIQNGHTLVLHVGTDQGTFELTAAGTQNHTPCTISVTYEVAYCCPDMRRLFLFLDSKTPVTESIPNCIQSHFSDTLVDFSKKLRASIDEMGKANFPDEPDFHFDFYKTHLGIVGSYRNRTTQLKLIELP
jgi:hypothetical protein